MAPRGPPWIRAWWPTYVISKWNLTQLRLLGLCTEYTISPSPSRQRPPSSPSRQRPPLLPANVPLSFPPTSPSPSRQRPPLLPANVPLSFPPTSPSPSRQRPPLLPANVPLSFPPTSPSPSLALAKDSGMCHAPFRGRRPGGGGWGREQADCNQRQSMAFLLLRLMSAWSPVWSNHSTPIETFCTAPLESTVANAERNDG